MADKLIVILDGGLVQHITGTGRLIGCEVTVIDYDTDGAGDDDVTEIEQGDGDSVPAYVRSETVGEALIPTDSFADFCKADPLASFVAMVARLNAAGDDMGEDEPAWEHDTGDSLDALDALIHRARELMGKPHDPAAVSVLGTL